MAPTNYTQVIYRRAQTLRQDRILQEAIVTSGDIRRLADLFGISVDSAQRYADVVLRPNEQALSDTTPPDGS